MCVRPGACAVITKLRPSDRTDGKPLIHVGIYLSTVNCDSSRTGSKGLSGSSGHHPSIQIICDINRGLITWLQTHSSFSSLNPLDLSYSLVLSLCTLTIGQHALLDKDWPWTNQKGVVCEGKHIRSVDFRWLHNSLTRSPIACSFSQISIIMNSFALCPWRATTGLGKRDVRCKEWKHALTHATSQQLGSRLTHCHGNLSLTVSVIIQMYLYSTVQLETSEHKLPNSQRLLSIYRVHASDHWPSYILIIFRLLLNFCLLPWDKEAFSEDMHQGYPH